MATQTIEFSGERGHTPRLLLTILILAIAGSAGASERWLELKTAYFGDRAIHSGETVIGLEAPKRAYDAATVPIVIKSLNPGQLIKQVHLIVDKNPLPLAGIFRINEAAQNWESIETRIRINEYTDVRAIAELEDGTLHMVSRFVKASGGCSAPAMSDMDLAMKRAGKMKLLFDPVAEGRASSAEAVIKISHPNNSGMQFDQISRNYIPAFYVHSIAAEIGGRQLIDVETNFSMSENPVVRLNFRPGSELPKTTAQMRVYAEDSKGNRYEKSLQLQQSTAAD